MNIVTCKTLTASVVFGLQKGYKDELITVLEFKNAVFDIQHEIKNELKVLLSAKMTLCEILFLGQDEPSATLEFIQYPKFQCDEKLWMDGVLLFTKKLMARLDQNRTVIVFPAKTMMLEFSDGIDPKVLIDLTKEIA